MSNWNYHCETEVLYEPNYVKTWWVGSVRLYVSGSQGHKTYYDHKLLYQSHLVQNQAEAGQKAIDWCKENNIVGYSGPIMSGMGDQVAHFVYGINGNKLC